MFFPSLLLPVTLGDGRGGADRRFALDPGRPSTAGPGPIASAELVVVTIVSYRHMYLLVRRYEEASWTAVLLPVSADGMIVTSSMSLLMDSRCRRRSGLLPWALLIIGSVASLAANVAVAEPPVVGRLIAAWPSCALIGSYELLMRQVRNATTQDPDRRLKDVFRRSDPSLWSLVGH